jgi:hypothetical protein
MTSSRRRRPRESSRTGNERDAFESVAKRLGCDPDLKAFDKKLGKIARANPPVRRG